MTPPQPQREVEVPSHEPLSVSVRAIGISAAALVAIVGLTLWAMSGLSRLLSPEESAEEVDSVVGLPVVAPQTTVGLNPNQAQDREDLEERQRVWLSQYTWVDAQQGVARIPIARAMEIVQEKGASVELYGGPADESGAPSESGGDSQ